MVSILIERGINMNIVDKKGKKAYDIAKKLSAGKTVIKNYFLLFLIKKNRINNKSGNLLKFFLY